MDRPGTEELSDLAAKARAGDVDARNRIVEAHLPAIVGIARQFRAPGVELSDLVQEGVMAAMRAAEMYDPAECANFIGYARTRIRRDIRLAIDRYARVIRIPTKARRAMLRWNRVARTLSERWGRQPSVEEVAEESGFSLKPERCVAKTWRYVASVMACAEPECYDSDRQDEREESPLDAMISEEELLRLFRATATLPPEERQAITLYYGLGGGEPMTFRAAAKVCGTYDMMIRRLVIRAERRLAEILAA